MRNLKQIVVLFIILNVIISIQVHQSVATTQPWQYQITGTPLGTISYSVSNSPLCDVCTKGQFCRIRQNNAICKAYCGDGIVAVGQQQNGYCDDGNVNPMDGCNKCKVTPGWYCENTGLQAGATSTCRRACGDGQLDPQFGQICDDGNRNTNDGCTSNCQMQKYYQCTTPIKALSTCNPVCGDGRRVGIELEGDRCDDFNHFDGDGCDTLCKVQFHYACSGAPSVCKQSCNNGIFNKFAQQQCDNGILTDQNGVQIIDGCDDNCQEIQGWVCEEYQTNNKASVCSAICGDRKINGKETCDDGNIKNGDGCDDKCQVQLGWYCLFAAGTGSACTPHCGDGRRVGGELTQTGCDDANNIQGDGCHNCQTQPHYVCTVTIDGITPQICTNVCGNAKLNQAAQQVCDNGQSTSNGNRVVDGCLQDCTTQSGYTCNSIDYSLSSCTL